MVAIIDYYLSLNSPWTYLGARRLAEVAAQNGAKVKTKPAKFTEVFAETGGLPLPKRSPERRAYRLLELRRWADYLKIPINIEPKFFPADEAHAARLVIAAAVGGLDALAISIEIGREVWECERNIGDVDVVKDAIIRAGVDYDMLTSNMPSREELDEVWEANTREAVSRGVFGAPSYVLETDEVFWGQDRLDFLERALSRD